MEDGKSRMIGAYDVERPRRKKTRESKRSG